MLLKVKEGTGWRYISLADDFYVAMFDLSWLERYSKNGCFRSDFSEVVKGFCECEGGEDPNLNIVFGDNCPEDSPCTGEKVPYTLLSTGDTHYVLVGYTAGYVLNDEGTTVDKI